MWRCIHKSVHWVVDVEEGRRIVRLVRSPVAFEAPADVDLSFHEVRESLSDLSLDGWGLIIDLRGAKPMQDPKVEAALRQNRKRLRESFARMAVFVATAAGALQLHRLLRAAPDPGIAVFEDEVEAVAWASQR